MIVFKYTRWMDSGDLRLIEWYKRFEARGVPAAIVESNGLSSVWVAGEPSSFHGGGEFRRNHEIVEECHGFSGHISAKEVARC